MDGVAVHGRASWLLKERRYILPVLFCSLKSEEAKAPFAVSKAPTHTSNNSGLHRGGVRVFLCVCEWAYVCL